MLICYIFHGEATSADTNSTDNGNSTPSAGNSNAGQQYGNYGYQCQHDHHRHQRHEPLELRGSPAGESTGASLTSDASDLTISATTRYFDIRPGPHR
jgi:hypothetical protein